MDEKKNILLQCIKTDKYLFEFIHILLHIGEDEIVKEIDRDDKFFVDLYNSQPFEYKYKFSFRNEIPRDEFRNTDKETSNSGYNYSMTRTPRGLCYIINNFFTIGTYKEAQRLGNIFYRLHFNVVIEKNKSIKEIIKKLEEYSKSCNQNDYDAFIFMIISYKNKNNEIVDLANEATKIDDLIRIFNNDNCPNMKEKPRLFFLNFCSSRGIKLLSKNNSTSFFKHFRSNGCYT